MISAKELKALLNYDPLTGIFVWKVDCNGRRQIGAIAGTDCNGYVHIKIRGIRYKAHRLAWLYMIDEWPKADIDHINRQRDDNRFSNLRQATPSQNASNRHSVKTGQKARGYHKKANGKFQATIRVSGTKKCLGTFNTENEASAAYEMAAATLKGEFYPI